jgi:LacI family transcriptional regulator
LHERGFRHYAFCGFNGADYSDERRDSFVTSVTESGLRCHVFGDGPESGTLNTAAYEEVGLQDGERVARWIKQLPKPIGLMACNDMRGQQLLSACRAGGVAVPDEVAVVGVDNEEVLCDLSDPPLSSVVPNTERVGYEAATLLQRAMRGRRISAQHIQIGPLGVATRRSTEVLAIEDRAIAAAARFIREHACEGIDVADVVRAVPLCRSSLERRYIKIMGHSPKHEILRFRLNRAKQLLAETDFPLSLIAEKIGLEHTEYLSRIFKKKTGQTPVQYRILSRTADSNDALPSSKA